MWEAIFFYAFAAVAVASALLMVLMKNPVVSAVYLVITFFSIAGLFVMLNAQLIAALQVIVYAGAIMVLFLFVIMLLNLNRTAFTSYKLFFTKVFALILIAVILWVVAGSLGAIPEQAGETALPPVDSSYKFGTEEAHAQVFAEMLFTRYVYPFEIIGIMLLAGIIGAVLMAKKKV
ncbi:MAG TPA: NADH-quinone oxidoreductase subunit J [Acidobacteriota bacterium]|nr:NADH-quinone oxidoreductase subunit J [Acidobacteriota bacterium]